MSENKTYLCRCEDITQEEVQDLLKDGVESFAEIKRITRCTMGLCQGKTCRHLIASEIAKFQNKPMEEVDVPTFRAPTRPIKLGNLIKEEGGEHHA